MAENQEKKYFIDSTKTIEENYNSIGTLTEDVVKEAAEKIATKMKEKQVKEVQEMMLKAEFFVERTYTNLHKSRDIEKIAKFQMEKVGALEKEVKEGKKPLQAFNKEIQELNKECLKRKREIDVKYCELEQVLNDRYPDNWYYRNELQGI